MEAVRVSKGIYVDDGTPLKCSAKACPNCGSSKYKSTVSKEECTACGLLCDYWGSGSNEVYDDYLARKHAADEKERREREDREFQW